MPPIDESHRAADIWLRPLFPIPDRRNRAVTQMYGFPWIKIFRQLNRVYSWLQLNVFLITYFRLWRFSSPRRGASPFGLPAAEGMLVVGLNDAIWTPPLALKTHRCNHLYCAPRSSAVKIGALRKLGLLPFQMPQQAFGKMTNVGTPFVPLYFWRCLKMGSEDYLLLLLIMSLVYAASFSVSKRRWLIFACIPIWINSVVFVWD